MHSADVATGTLGANGIVAGGPPIAAGAALSNKLRGTDQVCLCFHGDGAVGEGATKRPLTFTPLVEFWSTMIQRSFSRRMTAWRRGTQKSFRTISLPPDRPGLPASPSSPLFPSLLNVAVLLLASAIGAVAFVAPFFSLETALPGDGGALSHAADAPFFLILLIVICLGAVLLNLSAGQMNTRTVAVLGILTAFNAVLRALPGPGGFNAIFFLPILAGHVYGATFGFLLGSLALLVSALLGGGVGPWLPFQMFATGWVGMLGAFVPNLPRHPRREVILLATWGLLLGLLFGAIMNLWFWPFIVRPEPVSYTHLRAHETVLDLVCRLLLEQKKIQKKKKHLSYNHY